MKLEHLTRQYDDNQELLRNSVIKAKELQEDVNQSEHDRKIAEDKVNFQNQDKNTKSKYRT